METIYPLQNPNALQDQRLRSLIQYAMKVEKSFFEASSSRDQYYQLLAEKIYHIRRELEERRAKKMVDGLDSATPNKGDVVSPNQVFCGESMV